MPKFPLSFTKNSLSFGRLVQKEPCLKEPSEPATSGKGKSFHQKPLEGFVVVDFTNVLAGPNCGRMLCELGASVYKVRPGAFKTWL